MKRLVALAGVLTVIAMPAAVAQSSSGSEPTPGNPLTGLFTIGPQYQSGQSVQPQPGSQDNPLKGLFAIPPQYQSGNSVDVHPPADTANHFQNFFTNPSQYQSGQNVQPQPQHLDPTFIKDQIEKGYSPSDAEKKMVEDKFPDFFRKDQPAAKTQPGADSKTAKATDDKEKAPEKGKKKTDDKKKNKKPAAKEEPKQPVVYDPLKDAIFLYRTGQYDKSLAIIDSYIKTNGGDAKAHYLRAINLAAQGKNQPAAQEYGKVIQMMPMSPLAAEAAKGLRKINAEPPPPVLPPLKMTH